MLDSIDYKIIALLQQNATLSADELAAAVGLSKTPCWRRVQKLEQAGVIQKRVALIDANALGLGVSVFVQIRTNQHTPAWLQHFSDTVKQFPQVMEVYRMAGEWDYLLRVVVSDIAAYDQFYKALIEKLALTDVSSYFAMEQIKYTTALPVGAHFDTSIDSPYRDHSQ